jgi:hypothetical protein
MSLSDADRARQLARFRNLRGRGIAVSFPPLGPVVQASDPQELQEATDQALAEVVSEEPAS